MVKNPLESLLQFYSWVRKIHWRSDRLPIPIFLGFPCGSAGKESTCNVGDLGPIPGLGRPPREGKDYPLQYSGLENSREYIVRGVTESQTRLNNFHFQVCHRFSPRSKCLLVSWLQLPTAVILEPQNIKSVTVSIVSLSTCHEMIKTGFHDIRFNASSGCYALSQLFHSPLSPSSKGSLVSLSFLP